MPLFEVALLQVPTRKEIEEEGKSEKLLMAPKAVVAADAQGAAIAAVIGNDDLDGSDMGRVKVLVRPFV